MKRHLREYWPAYLLVATMALCAVVGRADGQTITRVNVHTTTQPVVIERPDLVGVSVDWSSGITTSLGEPGTAPTTRPTLPPATVPATAPASQPATLPSTRSSTMPTTAPAFEPLEKRLLLAPLLVNFQPTAADPLPAGYVIDAGKPFGDRGGGLKFGWDVDNAAHARDRDASNSPSEPHDTLTHLQKTGGARKWEMELPNGTYVVRVVAGDPGYFDSFYKIDVEGVLAVNAAPSSATRWREGTVTVTVTDGRLTITNAAGAANNKICFVEIDLPTAQPPATQPAPVGDLGWTTFKRAPDAKAFYVNLNGSDSNPGTIDRPLKSPAEAYYRVVSGRGDQIFLDAGDDFAVSLPFWKKGGREGFPLLVTYYADGENDDTLPTIRGVYSSGLSLHDVAFVGLRFYDARRDPDSGAFDVNVAKQETRGIEWSNEGRNLLVEGCQFSYFWKGLNVSPGSVLGKPLYGLKVHRNVVAWSYSLGSHSQGMYANTFGGDVTITENVFHHNGWSEHPRIVAFKNADGKPLARSTIFNHNIYLDERCGGGSVINGNIVSAGASHGIQQRPGGVCRDNFLIDNAIAWTGADEAAIVENNVILRGRDIEGEDDGNRGHGIWPNKAPDIEIRNNIIANKTAGIGKYGHALFFEYNNTKGFNGGTYRAIPDNARIVNTGNIIFNWRGAVRGWFVKPTDFSFRDGVFSDAATPYVFDVTGFAKLDEDFRGNRYFTRRAVSDLFLVDGVRKSFPGWQTLTGDNSVFGAVNFPDPYRHEGTYHASIGGEGTAAAFMTACLKQSRLNWDPKLTAAEVTRYIRAGFGIGVAR